MHYEIFIIQSNSGFAKMKTRTFYLMEYYIITYEFHMTSLSIQTLLALLEDTQACTMKIKLS